MGKDNQKERFFSKNIILVSFRPVSGSPFRVEALPDPSDIYVHGQGVEEGIMRKELMFKVDAATGVDNNLLVTITCKYTIVCYPSLKD